jgi:hypothetical protein
MTATYWEQGRRIVEFEQGGEKRAGYEEELIPELADDLGRRFGRGFSYPNLSKFRQFYLAYSDREILSTASRDSASDKLSTPSIRQTPGRHSLSKAGAYPLFPVLAFSQRLGNTERRVPNRSRNSATFSAGDWGVFCTAGADGNSSCPRFSNRAISSSSFKACERTSANFTRSSFNGGPAVLAFIKSDLSRPWCLCQPDAAMPISLRRRPANRPWLAASGGRCPGNASMKSSEPTNAAAALIT